MNKSYNMDGYEALAAAIVLQAVKDYEKALIMLRRNTGNAEAQKTVKRCELFFRRDMGALSSIDGEILIRKIKERASRGRV